MSDDKPDPQYVYLTIADSVPELHRMGVTTASASTVRGMADRGNLPFFKAPDGKRRISLEQLRLAYLKPQLDAVRKCKSR